MAAAVNERRLAAIVAADVVAYSRRRASGGIGSQKTPGVVEALCEGLRRAGLPE
jgi:hypothetical protein